MAKTHKPDFSPFEDWLIDGPAGEWPQLWETGKELSDIPRQIVAANAALLLDREAWHARVAAFEAAIEALADEAAQKAMRANHHIRLDQHAFADGSKNFTDYRFPCSISFNSVVFGEGGVSFGGSVFGKGNVSFRGAIFGDGEVSFGGAVFGDRNSADCGTCCSSCTCLMRSNLHSIDVREQREHWKISFSRAKFGNGKVWFDKTVFGNCDTDFTKVNFGNGGVYFNEANFGNGTLWLTEANFGEGNVLFSKIYFQSTALRASKVIVDGDLRVNSCFAMPVDFSQLDVKGIADFSRSRFTKVPDFRYSKFDRPPEVAAMEVPRPNLGHGGGRSKLSPLSRALFSTVLDADDVAKYRKLKAMALAANDHEKDGEFFAGEMLAKRGVETTSFAGLLFNTFYWKLSDFGQSFTLPFFWMIRVFLIFAAANVAVMSLGAPATLATISSCFEAMVFSVVLSLKNAIPLLGSLFRFAAAPENHKGWFQTYYDTLIQHTATADWLIGLGVLESIIGGVLLFLFLLALRNKFRLK